MIQSYLQRLMAGRDPDDPPSLMFAVASAEDEAAFCGTLREIGVAVQEQDDESVRVYSNDLVDIFDSLPSGEQLRKLIVMFLQIIYKVLGMNWDPKNDTPPA